MRPEGTTSGRTPAWRIPPSLLAGLLVACAGAPVPIYEGTPRPLEEVATLRASGPVTIREVDYERVPRLESHLAILPGKHYIVLSAHRKVQVPWFDGRLRVFCETSLDMKAGRGYFVESWIEEGPTPWSPLLEVRIVDEVTGERTEPDCWPDTADEEL